MKVVDIKGKQVGFRTLIVVAVLCFVVGILMGAKLEALFSGRIC